ncbi:MAG: cation-translocating P-type ATPase [Bacteroidetes bacterium]|nr:cation-translocating P-type ATPase [Bacteroidota bacterium]
MPENNFNISGLTESQVSESREKFGANKLAYKKENGFIDAVRRVVTEPMVLLLLVASSIYFISGKTGDALFMAASIVLISIISLYQDSRSRNALEKLKLFTAANCKVIREGKTIEIKSEDLVVGDHLLVEEGISIPADGIIVHSNDFSVNESLLTGESLSVYKDKNHSDPTIYSGTNVNSGLAIAKVTAIGNATKLGKIGKSLEGIKETKTPLESQISYFVKMMVGFGAVIFGIVWGINYSKSGSITDSLLQALTLAMSILPEEIPVAFTTFMALGAWRLMHLGIVVKQMKTVETLGSATIICTDKTGTITENSMSLAKIFSLSSHRIIDPSAALNKTESELIRIAMWASEPIPFDPMEKAIHEVYTQMTTNDERKNYKLVHEYPLGGIPPMMTHLFQDANGNKIIAAKGAPEAIIKVSALSEEEKNEIQNTIHTLAEEGYRVLAVGETKFQGENYPTLQEEFKFNFRGLIAFYDPPKKNMREVLQTFYTAGILVKIVTGDNAMTTQAIAKQIGFRGFEKSMSGDELMKLNEAEVNIAAMEISIFTRMYPEAKLKLINALKSQDQIVAMTGDGVNDGPALKAAHIGIAMGKRGTEIAKQAASLILADDDLSKMTEAVAMGRKIYANLKKAIQYIISIHIPIILTVFIPLALGWKYPFIFSPVHIIFLELIMGPTCSIIYENEPMEKNTMLQPPRPYSSTFFNGKELFTSILQGLAITTGTLTMYHFAVAHHYNEEITRTMVFTTLITANIFLTLVNRSFFFSIFSTLRYKNNLVLLIILSTVVLTACLLFIPPLTNFFSFELLLKFNEIIVL